MLRRAKAEREGFEPSIPRGIHAFQACSIGHSDTSPGMSNFVDCKSNQKSEPKKCPSIFCGDPGNFLQFQVFNIR